MSNHKSLISVEKRILLHLLNCPSSENKYEVPIALTQNGIAQAVGSGRSYISSSIGRLKSSGYVWEYIGRVERGKKKQKYFLLTDKGKGSAQRLRKELSNLTITMELPDGMSKMMKINNIIPFLNREKICSDINELNIYNVISKYGTIDIEHLKNIKKMQFHDFSAEAPRIVHFFGREREMALLKKWVEDKEGYNIIFIHGIAGIGKTTLVAKLIETYRGSKHLFWHNFHELDTLWGILLKLAEFLSKLGHDHLEMHLRTRTTLDYYAVSKILGKSIGVIDAVLIFDNFHKSNDKIRAFFIYINRMVVSSSKMKMLILSREIVPFSDVGDVIAGENIAELDLNGLDFENSKRLLKEKGIDKRRFKEMYKLTLGNPLFLEILGGSKDRLGRYIHDEIYSKLGENERKILEIISIYRFPVPEDCLTMDDDIDFEKLYALTQKSILKKDARDRYFAHDILKESFYSRLSSSERRKHHLFAARWYENRDEPIDFIEAIYHYQEAGEYEKASQFAIDSSATIFDGGCAVELLVTLERFDEKKLESSIWAKILIVKGKACYMDGEWKKAILYFTRSADIATMIGDKKLEVKAVYESGYILEEQNELEKSMECFKRCLEISNKDDYLLGIGSSYRGIGRIHWRRSEHDEAISNFEKCLEISEKSGDFELIASTYIDLGNVYDEMYETEKAIEHYKKSLDVLEKIKNPRETARAYGNIAVTYQHLGDFDKAIEYNTKQLTITQNLCDINLIGHGYANISYCYAKIDEFEKAKEYANKAEEIALKIDSENIMFMVYKTYTLICKHEERWDQAICYFKRSIEIVDKLNALYYLSDAHFELVLLYEKIGDTKEAKKHLNIAQKLYSQLGLEKAVLALEKLSKY